MLCYQCCPSASHRLILRCSRPRQDFIGSNMISTSAILLALAAQTYAHSPEPTHGQGPGDWHDNSTLKNLYPANAACVEYTIPIAISYERIDFNFTHWEDDYEFEQFVVAATTRAVAGTPSIVAGLVQTNASYQVAASFCTPRIKNGRESTVILATHGIGPARDQYNPAFEPDNYSFTQWAIGQGYSIFLYDRVGTGDSSRSIAILFFSPS